MLNMTSCMELNKQKVRSWMLTFYVKHIMNTKDPLAMYMDVFSFPYALLRIIYQHHCPAGYWLIESQLNALLFF